MKLTLVLAGMLLLNLMLTDSQVYAADAAATRVKIEQSLRGSIRSTAERNRDANRKPAQVLEFFGLQDNMKVLEISPATGYWSKFLGPTLCNNGGQLVVSVGVNAGFRDNVMSLNGLNCVRAINDSITLANTPPFQFDEADFDMVLTFWNFHNLNVERRANLNKAVFDALEPGGIYGIVDHTRRHNQPTTSAVARRLDPMLIVKELLDAGFEFEAFSNIHYHAEDSLREEVGSQYVQGNTDRFTLKFRKPL